MKTSFAIGAAAALSLLALQPALAQDASSQVSSAVSSATSEASSAMTTTSSEASGAMSAETTVDYAGIITALQAGETADLTTITDTSTINFVLMSDLKANGDATALADVMPDDTEAATLKSNVDTNAALTAKLEAAGYSSNQVVAVTSGADGAFTVVINDEHP